MERRGPVALRVGVACCTIATSAWGNPLPIEAP
jgi:hypothetical protein